jgi:pyruvate,water dikinase
MNFLRLGSLVRGFYDRVEAALVAGRADLGGLPAEDLAARYRDLEQKLLRHWDAPVLNDFFLTIFHGALQKLTARWIRDESGTLQNDLLCGEGALLGHEAAERVRHMAQLASCRPDVVDALCASSRVAIERTLRTMPELESAYRDYVERLGDRCLEELKLESSTLHDDPMPLLRSVGHHAQCILAGSLQSTDHATELRQQSEARVLQALRSNPIKRWVFRWVLANTRRQVRERENLRFERTRVFGLARRIALEMGKRLSALDLLADPHDIFFLRVDEMLSIVEGTAVSTDLRGLVDLRRSEYNCYRGEEEPASRFETRGIVYVGEQHRGALENRAPDGESIKGIGCCSGIVRGRARFVTDPASARLDPGDIAVAERTDPGWVMIFPSASGLLVERGSALSHSAIVAREIGLPTIVSVPNLTAWLEDGEWVEMNGGTGEIVKVSPTRGSDVA